ncbi:MAG: serine hydrolase, partial [Deinococcus sp.]
MFTSLLCLLPGGSGQVWGAELAASPSCGPAIVAPTPRTPLPAGVSGRVSFYAALYDARSGQVIRELALGHANELYPLASLFKPLVVRAALEDVDAGRLSLTTGLATTPATRSIEAFPPGVNSVQRRVRRAIVQSDNTASDLLQLAHGPGQLAREVLARSPCTAVLLTTKAWWAAQAGLAPGVLGRDRAAGARRYARLPFEERVAAASQLIAASRRVTGPGLEAALEHFFHGPEYRPELELNLQNTGTARAYTELM